MNGARFNGHSSYITVTENTDFNISNSDNLTILLDIGELIDNGNTQYIVHKYVYGTAGWYTYTGGDMRIRFGVHGEGNALILKTTSTINTTSYFAFQYTNNKIIVFGDGRKEAEADVSFQIGTTTNSLDIGRYLNGTIRRIAIFKRYIPHSLIADGFDAILKYYNPDLYYDFRLGHARDLSGNSNHGSLYDVEFVAGASKSGAWFNGLNSRIEIPSVISGLNQFTVFIEHDNVRSPRDYFYPYVWGEDGDVSRARIYGRYGEKNVGVYITGVSGDSVVEIMHTERIVGFIYDYINKELKIYYDNDYIVRNLTGFSGLGSLLTSNATGFIKGLVKKMIVIPRIPTEQELAHLRNGNFENVNNPILFYDFTHGHTLDLSGNNNHGIPHNVEFI